MKIESLWVKQYLHQTSTIPQNLHANTPSNLQSRKKENKNGKQLQFLSSWRNRHNTVTSYLMINPIEKALETENLIENIHVEYIFCVREQIEWNIKIQRILCTAQSANNARDLALNFFK